MSEIGVETQADFLKGDKGDAGYTPVKGIDYYTDEEKQEFVNDITNNVTDNMQPFISEQNRKIDDVVSNIKDMTDEYNTNAVDKINEFNSNANAKVIEYNDNANAKIKEYNTNAEELINKISILEEGNTDLQIENERLRADLNGLPKGTAEGENIDLTDSADMRFSSFEIRGNSKQNGTPTPETHVDVKSCGDNVNIVNVTIGSQTKDGITCTNNGDGSVTLNGTATQSTSFTIAIPNITSKKYGYYTLSNKIASGSYLTARLRISLKNKEATINLMDKDISEVLTANIQSDTGDLRIWCEAGVVLNNIRIYTKLERGSTATPYSPYGQGCINEVICNKNLFDKNKAITTIGWYNADGSTTNGGDSTRIENYTEIPNNKDITINAKGLQSIILYDKDKKFIKRITTNNQDQYTFKEENVYFIRFQTSTSKLDLNSIQIEEGTIATEYEEHQSQTFTIPTQQPMRSVGDIKDIFIKKGNEWYERHYINRKIFNGTENWTYISNTRDMYAYAINLENKILGTHLKEYSSNMFEQKPNGNWDKDGFVSVSNTSAETYLFVTGFATANEWKTHLQEQYNLGTPVYVDYVLATPTDIECTSEQVAVLDEIENTVKSYKGATHIYSTDEVGANIKAIYFKDIETMINNLNTAIVALGGV